jgi:hypothetical protein
MRVDELRKGCSCEEKARDLESDRGYRVANGSMEERFLHYASRRSQETNAKKRRRLAPVGMTELFSGSRRAERRVGSPCDLGAEPKSRFLASLGMTSFLNFWRNGNIEAVAKSRRKLGNRSTISGFGVIDVATGGYWRDFGDARFGWIGILRLRCGS